MQVVVDKIIQRVEIINHCNNKNHMGRLFTAYKDLGDFDRVEISVQDEGETLKIFLLEDKKDE